jgi:hypothetical protein
LAGPAEADAFSPFLNDPNCVPREAASASTGCAPPANSLSARNVRQYKG